MYHEVPPVSLGYQREQRPGRTRVGFVYSEFARRLERENYLLKQQINKNS